MNSLQKLTHLSKRTILSSSRIVASASQSHRCLLTDRGQRSSTASSPRSSLICQRSMSSLVTRTKVYDLSSLTPGDLKIIEARKVLRMSPIPKHMLRKSSIFMYEACTDKLSIERFMKELGLKDSFSVWFTITSLHVYMAGIRCLAEDPTIGKDLRNELITRMWEDVRNRMEKLPNTKTKHKKHDLTAINHEFNAMMFALDEGMLSDDIVLAGAVWRFIFSLEEQPRTHVIEMMVHYIRCQLEHLHLNVKSEQLLFNGDFDWEPFEPLIPPKDA